MRVNSNKKIHKMKRDPYKTLLRTAGILAIVVVVGVGVFYLCSLAVTNDYVSTRNRIENENAEAELEFNAMMNCAPSKAPRLHPTQGWCPRRICHPGKKR